MADFTNKKLKPLEQWVEVATFNGFQTKLDASKIADGANTNGQNTTMNDGDRISVRAQGYELFPLTGIVDNTSEPITSTHTFRKRNGDNVMMRSHGTTLEYFNTDSLLWTTLKNTYTYGKKFGYADYNINTDVHSYVYFGNGYDSFSRWGGGFSKFASASNQTGATSSLTLNFGGDGYALNDIVTVSGGGGTGATIQVTSLSSKAVKTVTGVNVGASYVLNDIVILAQPGSDNNATAKITSVDGGGGVTSFTMLSYGSNYVVSATQVYLVDQTHGGYGATVDITAVTNASITGFNVQTVGTGYAVTTGAATTTTGAGTGATINIVTIDNYSITTSATGQASITDRGFSPTGGQFIWNGNVYGYNSSVGNTLLGISVDPTTIGMAVGDVITDAVREYPTNPKGNIYIVANNRLFIAGITIASQAVYFSYYGDATNFLNAAIVTSTTLLAPGIFNLGEGGGPVVGLTQDEQSLYAIKRSIIYAITLSDTQYTLKPLKPFDGKSQTVGGVNSQSCFTGGNGVFFITPDNQILKLSRLANLDYPQASSISNVIKPTVDDLDFSVSSGIVFRDKAYFACKSTPTVAFNDTVLVWNITQQFWDSPITGWNVGDFVVYNNGTTEDLYLTDAVSINTYKINSTPTDGEFDVKASWKSKQYNFAMPYAMKQMSNVFIEGYINPNTTLTINLYLDDNGFTHTYTTTLNGASDTQYLYNTAILNKFGLNKFGVERFGSNPDSSGKVKFRLYLGKDTQILPFYTAQLEFISDGQNQQWEITNYCLKAGEYSMPYLRKLYKSFK